MKRRLNFNLYKCHAEFVEAGFGRLFNMVGEPQRLQDTKGHEVNCLNRDLYDFKIYRIDEKRRLTFKLR
jgi:hypothetical protein